MIKEIIVVEGKDDTVAIKRAVEADTIETNGSAIGEDVLRRIALANERRGIIIFTDPDHAGERIRKIVARHAPGCKHAFLPQEKALYKGDIGIENASPEAIRTALSELRTETADETGEVSFEDFAAALKKRKTRVKSLLLNQSFLRGVGNIYADEALFRAGIHPLALASRIRTDRARKLYDAIVAVLQEAIAAGGSSISDYVDAEGRAGFFQISHRVYQRTGEPCVTCGGVIRRTIVSQRSSHFCPTCQKR